MITIRRLATVVAVSLAWNVACTNEHPTGTADIIIQPCFGPGHAGVKKTPVITLALVRDGKTVQTKRVKAPYGVKVSLPAATYTIRATGPDTMEVHPDTAIVKIRDRHITVVRVGEPCL